MKWSGTVMVWESDGLHYPLKQCKWDEEWLFVFGWTAFSEAVQVRETVFWFEEWLFFSFVSAAGRSIALVAQSHIVPTCKDLQHLLSEISDDMIWESEFLARWWLRICREWKSNRWFKKLNQIEVILQYWCIGVLCWWSQKSDRLLKDVRTTLR